MDVRNCGVWCALGDDVSRLEPGICGLIFEIGKYRLIVSRD